MALFHFLFELIKIGLLSSLYATTVLAIILLTSKIIPTQKLSELMTKKRKFWILIMRVVYAVLFVFMFTYWGNHGLGDEAILPIGNFKIVVQSDGNYNYIENNKGRQLNIKNFAFDDRNLYAETSDTIKGDYVCWNLHTNEWKFYNNQAALNNKSQKLVLLQAFGTYYNSYWNGWRFWLLP